MKSHGICLSCLTFCSARFPLCECVPSRFSRVWLFVTPWTIARQRPLSTGFSWQDVGGGCRALLQGISPTQGSNPRLPRLLCAGRFFTAEPPRTPLTPFQPASVAWQELVLFYNQIIFPCVCVYVCVCVCVSSSLSIYPLRLFPYFGNCK